MVLLYCGRVGRRRVFHHEKPTLIRLGFSVLYPPLPHQLTLSSLPVFSRSPVLPIYPIRLLRSTELFGKVGLESHLPNLVQLHLDPVQMHLFILQDCF